MLNLNQKLIQRQENDQIINVGIVGSGQMGKGLVSQIALMKGMKTVMLADIIIENAIEAFHLAKIHDEDIVVTNNIETAQDAIKKGKYVACEDYRMVCECPLLSTVVDATGITDMGALIAECAIESGKNIIMLNVETDVTIGHILKYKADQAGVIYSASSGDEPGAVKELYDFADAMGLDILVIGKGKNNKVDLECNPETVYEEATRRGIAPKMLASFKDGTKTMVEMTCMSNATGFLPDIRGAHGVKANTENVCDILRLKSEGGVLNNYKVVEYVDGLAPGVFIIVTTDMPQIHHEIQYLKVGKGPNYLLYRPYHLCSLETPLTIARAEIYKEACLIQKSGPPISETITVAKKDLKAGEYIDGIGGYTVYGSFETYKTACKENLVPIGLINKDTKVIRNVKKGEVLTFADLQFDQNSPVFKMRELQKKIIG